MIKLGAVFLAALCAGFATGCAGGKSTARDLSRADIANVKNVGAEFGPQFRVSDVATTGIDPRLFQPQPTPPGLKFEPADCSMAGSGQLFPENLQGNMAATTAEGEGNRFIAIAIETNEPVTLSDPGPACGDVTFSGDKVVGRVESVESPQIAGVPTLGSHSLLTTTANGEPQTGELYKYAASFGNFLVIVTANPLVLPNQPVVPVNTARARELLTAAVESVQG